MTYKVYGGEYRGDCPVEALDQAAFVQFIRTAYPSSHGMLIVHIENEGMRSCGQTAYAKKQGMTPGASDIIIPGSPSFVCELKRKNKTKSRVSEDQIKYLETAAKMGAFACLAYGYDAAVDAFNDYRKLTTI